MKKIFAILIASLLAVGTFTSCTTTKTNQVTETTEKTPEKNPNDFYYHNTITLNDTLYTVGLFKTDESLENCFSSFLVKYYGFRRIDAHNDFNSLKKYSWHQSYFPDSQIWKILDSGFKYLAFLDTQSSDEYTIYLYAKINENCYKKAIIYTYK